MVIFMIYHHQVLFQTRNFSCTKMFLLFPQMGFPPLQGMERGKQGKGRGREECVSHPISVRIEYKVFRLGFRVMFSLRTTSVYSTRHLSSAEDKNFPFCPQLRTQKTYGKQMLLSKLSTMAYLTMVVLPSWQLLTQYYAN